jgi:hypothetical protein
MPSTLKYIVDDSGNRTSVLVPLKVWDELNASYQKLQAKLAVLQSVQQGLKEVKAAKKSNRKLQMLKDFLK